jgi:hypothetical protein
MENEVLRAAAEKRGSRSRRRSGPDRMGHQLPLAMVCRVLGAPRSTI